MLPHPSIPYAFILLLYLGLVLAIGSYALMRQKPTADGYFFAGRSSAWLTLGASLFSSQFLLAAFFPLNGSVLAVALMVLSASTVMLIVTAALRLFTTRVGGAEREADALEQTDALFRWKSVYGAASMPVVVLGIVRIAAVLLFCSYAGELYTGWNPGGLSIIIILIVGLFTIVGGFRAVSALQAFLAAGAFVSLVALAVSGSGMNFNPELLPALPLFGLAVLIVWSWKADQYCVQHLAGARSHTDITKGLLVTIVMNILCIAVMLFAPSGTTMQPDSELPASIQAIVIAGVLSVVISSLGGLFSSTAAFITLHMVHPHLTPPSERKTVLIGRLVTTAIVIAAICTVMAVRALGTQAGGIMQSAIAAIAAPLAAVYCCNMVSRRRGWSEAGWPAVPALLAGVLRVFVEAAARQGVTMEAWAVWVMSIHFLELGFGLFAATCLIFAARMIQTLLGRYAAWTE